jgi:hypothetical protein
MNSPYEIAPLALHDSARTAGMTGANGTDVP